MSGDICPDDRFELIEKARSVLLEKTNIEMRDAEMAVLDSILFRCWQMGWLDQLRECTVLATVTDGLTGDDPKRYFELSCGHSLFLQGLEDVPKFCPMCGANVTSKAKCAMTNYEKLFGTPERAAQTLARMFTYWTTQNEVALVVTAEQAIAATLGSEREKELEELVRDLLQLRCRQSCADCEHEDDEGCDFMTRALELGIEVY